MKSKLECMSVLCPHNDTDKERNCQNWRPGDICGFRDKGEEVADDFMVSGAMGQAYSMCEVKPVKLEDALTILEEPLDMNVISPDRSEEILKTLDGRKWVLSMDELSEKDREELGKQSEIVSAFAEQIGGSHYKDMAIQPTEYCQKNGLNACEANIVKYASRHRNKGGRQDVEKIIHYAKLLLEMEY